MKKIGREEEKEEKKQAALLLGKSKLNEILVNRKKLLEELKNIQQMEERMRARESIARIKRGEDVNKLFGEFKEMVDLSPPKEDYIEVVEVHPIVKPYSYVRILYDNKNHEYIYEVLEPKLNVEERKLLDFIKETLIKTMDVELTEFSEDEAKEYLRRSVDRVIKDYSISMDDTTREKIMYYVTRDFLGYGKIDVLMRDIMIEDISCDSAATPLFIYHRNYESMKTNLIFQDDNELN